jgi:hypothetical protein
MQTFQQISKDLNIPLDEVIAAFDSGLGKCRRHAKITDLEEVLELLRISEGADCYHLAETVDEWRQ